MDLNALELFVAAAEAGSLSKAVLRTGVPLPTLSRRVRRLEDELGLRLLERGSQGLALTPAGTLLLTEVGPALRALSQAEQRLHDASGVAGTLRVSIPPHFEPMWSVFAGFRRCHPAARFDVFVTDRRVDLVADGVDVVLRVGEGGHTSYEGRTLARYRHRVVAAPALLEGIRIHAPADLDGVACGAWRTGRPPSWTLAGNAIDLHPIVVTNDYEHLLHLALAGEVVTELPPFMARQPLRDGRLVEVLPDFPMAPQSVRALVADVRALAPLVRQFLDFAAEAVPPALELDPKRPPG